jgi:hypothetical protein
MSHTQKNSNSNDLKNIGKLNKILEQEHNIDDIINKLLQARKYMILCYLIYLT